MSHFCHLFVTILSLHKYFILYYNNVINFAAWFKARYFEIYRQPKNKMIVPIRKDHHHVRSKQCHPKLSGIQILYKKQSKFKACKPPLQYGNS